MTDSTDSAPADGVSSAPKRTRKAGLEGMLLPELKQVASGLGLRTTGMRKGQIVEAIKASQSGGQSGGGQSGGGQSGGGQSGASEQRPRKKRDQAPPVPEQTPTQETSTESREKLSGEHPKASPAKGDGQSQRAQDREREQDRPDARRPQGQEPPQGRQESREPRDRQGQAEQPPSRKSEQQDGRQQDSKQQDSKQQDSKQQDSRQQDGDGQQDDDQGGSRRNRRRRGRDRDRGNTPGNQGNQGNQAGPDRGGNDGGGGRQDRQDRADRQGRGSREPDLQILEDDVLTPCAGILDLMDNYAFVRTSGYLPGVDDVYVSMSMVRKHGLRRGDAVAGQVRQPREGERKEKFNPLVRIDSVNGADPDSARTRVEFAKLTPLNPTERLRMETGPGDLVGRLVDLAAPLGKGQRAVVLSPPRAGKTTVLQSMARSITTNHPECHLMVVLVDERPEEVTDFQRSIKGEVIGSTFDRVPADHTVVAELALERAMRLVELGHDVVVLLDGLTRLARAYNLAATHSVRALPSGLDIHALHPPKRLFGAARKVENGGSLTIVATASVETGSAIDEAILEEMLGTANAELWLQGELAEQRLYPTIDPVRSRTRRQELLLGEQEAELVSQLTRRLAATEAGDAHAQLLERLHGTGTNVELLRRVQAEAAGGSH